jgi:N-acetyl-gamma-glutamyl-phosphate reductase
MTNVGIIGATGYVGIEIVRLLQQHPQVNITSLVSQSFSGEQISNVYPNLYKIFDLECVSLDIDKISNSADIFITALPHNISKTIIPTLVENGKRIIDHSSDFRYKDIDVYEKTYNTKHEMPYLLQSATYGLPELYRSSIKNSTIIGNPGCYPTCSILALAPLIKNKIIDFDNIVINAASGISGVGRSSSLSNIYCECSENYRAYNISTHRHTSEIEQELSLIGNSQIRVSFNTHLVPMKRGLLCTTTANLSKPIDTNEVLSVFKEFYKDEFFVRILEYKKLPETKWVSGSNFIDIALVIDKRLNKIIVLSALDNLIKGAAGQAIQNLNIMCGYPENTALKLSGLYI